MILPTTTLYTVTVALGPPRSSPEERARLETEALDRLIVRAREGWCRVRIRGHRVSVERRLPPAVVLRMARGIAGGAW